MANDLTMHDVVRLRRSCRSFSHRPVETSVLTALEDYLTDINLAMPIPARIMLAAGSEPASGRMGTYGVIAGAHSFLVGIVDRSITRVELFGYQFEKVILYATRLGLGTCWLGGTFNRQRFEARTGLAPNESIPIISPVGYAADKPRITDRLMRTMARSDQRKPWQELFFDQTPDQPLSQEMAGPFADALEHVRLAPSASNKQPWRVIRDQAGFHFYLLRTQGYNLLTYDMQRNDIGIAMCHFELTAQEQGLPGRWQQGVAAPEYSIASHLASWIIQDGLIHQEA